MKLDKLFSNVKIKNKLLFTGFVLSVVPVVVVGAFLIFRLTDLSKAKAISLLDINASQLVTNIQSYYNQQQNTVAVLREDTGIKKYLSTYYLTGVDSLESYLEYAAPVINRFKSTGGTVIKIFSNNPTVNISSETNNLVSELPGYSWFDPQSTSRYNWNAAESINNGLSHKYIVCYWTDREAYEKKVKQVIAVFTDNDLIHSMFASSMSADTKVFLVDGGGKILSSTEDIGYSQKIYDLKDDFGNPYPDIKDHDIVTIGFKKYIAIAKEIEGANDITDNWQLLCFVPYGSVSATLGSVILPSTLLVTIFVLFAVILTLILSRNITGRLNRLMSGINKVTKGNFETIPKLEGNDEISDISSNFNLMVQKINELIQTVYVTNIEKRDAQISAQNIELEKIEAERLALLRQINPHYLFNTLESIRMNLIIKDDRETAEIVRLFSSGIRAYLDYNDEYTTLGEEIKFVDNYLQIQKYRFGDKIHFDKYVDEKLLGCKVLRLILQPLVENAVYHGIERKAEGGTIIIEAYASGDDLKIKVTDNGGGMDGQTLEKLRSNLYGETQTKEGGASGIALKNIHNRLNLVYGKRYGLTISSREGVGTEAEVLMPLVMTFFENT